MAKKALKSVINPTDDKKWVEKIKNNRGPEIEPWGAPNANSHWLF